MCSMRRRENNGRDNVSENGTCSNATGKIMYVRVGYGHSDVYRSRNSRKQVTGVVLWHEGPQQGTFTLSTFTSLCGTVSPCPCLLT